MYVFIFVREQNREKAMTKHKKSPTRKWHRSVYERVWFVNYLMLYLGQSIVKSAE